jgi:hypothetical protein
LPLCCGLYRPRTGKRVFEIQAILLAVVIQLLGGKSIYRTEEALTDHHLARMRLANATTTSSIAHVRPILDYTAKHLFTLAPRILPIP